MTMIDGKVIELGHTRIEFCTCLAIHPAIAVLVSIWEWFFD